MGTDSLYYIMDYSGHYYRTNQADQLVAAAGEQEATVFTLAQANRHIGVGKKASFYCPYLRALGLQILFYFFLNIIQIVLIYNRP